MLYTQQTQITYDSLESYEELTDEYMFRQLAVKLMNEIHISDLKKLIKFTKIDPRTQEIRDKINDWKITETERAKLLMLAERNVILFEALTII